MYLNGLSCRMDPPDGSIRICMIMPIQSIGSFNQPMDRLCDRLSTLDFVLSESVYIHFDCPNITES